MRFKRFKLYWVRFYDHAMGTEDLLVCEIAGWVTHVSPDHVTFTSWLVVGEDEQTVLNNSHFTSIYKKCIIDSKAL